MIFALISGNEDDVEISLREVLEQLERRRIEEFDIIVLTGSPEL